MSMTFRDCICDMCDFTYTEPDCLIDGKITEDSEFTVNFKLPFFETKRSYFVCDVTPEFIGITPDMLDESEILSFLLDDLEIPAFK